MKPAWWRKWHRWIGFPASLFLLFASVTGFFVAGTEFFGADEALREANRDLISPVTARSAGAIGADRLARALATVAARAGDPPVDKVTVEFKGQRPTITVFTGKATGGEDRKLVLDARTGVLISSEVYADKPFLYRLHSGEVFGDGGLIVAMFWALSLAVLTVTGFIIYWRMRRADATGWRRIFW